MTVLGAEMRLNSEISKKKSAFYKPTLAVRHDFFTSKIIKF